jgi:import inner membrane translocase subunit TIM23
MRLLFEIALMYNAVNSTIDAVRGEHDFAGGMAAAAISGAIFKSTGEFGRITIEE